MVAKKYQSKTGSRKNATDNKRCSGGDVIKCFLGKGMSYIVVVSPDVCTIILHQNISLRITLLLLAYSILFGYECTLYTHSM